MHASWNVHDSIPRLDNVHHGHDGSDDGGGRFIMILRAFGIGRPGVVEVDRLGEVSSCEKIWNMMQTVAKVDKYDDDDQNRILAGAMSLAYFGTSMMTNSLQEQEGGTNRPS